jgi:hypothetical protein
MSQPADVAKPKTTYQVGTLTYTKMGLLGLFFWLLWGDLCFGLMESVTNNLPPLQLKDAGASLFWIGIIMGTLPQVLNMILNPIISTWSDRHRGPTGRRIPFLRWPSFFIMIFLILTAYGPDIGTWLQGAAGIYLHLALSRASAVLIVLGVCMVGFQIFHMFVATVFYYLWADVVPEVLMGRFLASMRYMSAGTGMIWSYYIFGLADRHMKAIYIGIGILYCGAFVVMCLRVKEGEYPPPPEAPSGGGVGMVKTYFVECFRNPYYVWFFLGTALFGLAGCTNTFRIFLYRDTLKLSLDQIGKVYFWGQAALLVLLAPAGWICDKLHSLRVQMGMYVIWAVVALLSFFFIHDARTLLIFWLLESVPRALNNVSNYPMCVSLLPRDRFGQFCSAQALLQAVLMVVGIPMAGAFLDWIKDYRYVYLWLTLWTIPSFFFMILLYVGWRRHGGAKNYVPPPVDKPRELLKTA